jgi:PleD family two-component response regulator
MRPLSSAERDSSLSEPFSRPPLVLIASDQEWASRALDSSLGPQGYAILRAYNGKQAMDLISRGHPDLVVISEHLSDSSGLDICQTLREKTLVTDSTAILVTVDGPVSKEVRITALRAGASDCLGLPIDGDELGLRLMPFVRAKFDADRARDQGLIDPATGLYNIGGLTRRARELGSQAYRNGSAVAWGIFAPELDSTTGTEVGETLNHLARALNRAGRVSDAIGRMSDNNIALFAPETGGDGAEKLTQRLQTAIQHAGAPAGARFRTGYFAVPNFRDAPMDPEEMLFKAGAALAEKKKLQGGDARAN